MSYETIEGGAVPIKAWTRGVPVEDEAKQQLRETASLPIVGPHIAVMPDCHFGIGATVGSVVPTRGAVVPAAVGVDIGCFVGETRIPLLNGRQKTFRELADETAPFWVYSTNASGEIVPGLARCLKTIVHTLKAVVCVKG